MKHLLAFAFLLIGCGAEYEEVDGLKIGTLEQALTVPSGYGIQEFAAGTDSFPCGAAPFPSNNGCFLPADKVMRIRSFAPPDSNGVNWSQAIGDGITKFTAVYGSRGWDALVSGAGSETVVQVIFDAMPAGSPKAKSTIASACTQVAGSGRVCKFQGCAVSIFFKVIETSYGGAFVWNGLSQVERNRIVRNSTLHELGHCGGWGHSSAGTMAVNSNDVLKNGLLDFTASQKNAIQAYVP